jgi:SAM-dependent methyltransferase
VPAGSRSFAREWEALEPPGSVIDVGAGTGDASLPLRARATEITAVDKSGPQLAALEDRGRLLGVHVRTICGAWPAVADRVGRADLVVCHYVLYEIRDLEPFVAAMTSAARRRVVVTLPVLHPQGALTPLWEHFHGLPRPTGPQAELAVEIIENMGLRPASEAWVDVDGFGGYADFAEMVDRTRRRLCLPPERNAEVGKQLLALGVDPASPMSLGTVGRQVVTVWWDVAFDSRKIS